MPYLDQRAEGVVYALELPSTPHPARLTVGDELAEPMPILTLLQPPSGTITSVMTHTRQRTVVYRILTPLAVVAQTWNEQQHTAGARDTALVIPGGRFRVTRKFYQGVLMVELVQIGPSRSPYAISQDEPAPTVVADTSGDSVEPTQPIPIITPDSKLSDHTAIATRPRRSARLSSARVSRDATRPGATPAEQISPQSADTTPTTAHPAGPGAGPDTTVAATADGPHTAKPTEYSTFQPVRSGYLAAADEASRTAASKFPALPVRMLFGHTDPFNDKLLAIPHDNGEPSYVDVDTAAVWAKAVAPGKPWWLMTCGAKRLAEAFQSKGITAMYLDGVIHQTEKGISTGPLKRKGLEVDLTLPLPEESERWVILWGDGTKTDYATWQEALRALIPDLDDDLLELVRKATINPGHIAWILAGPTRRSPA